MGHKKTKEAKIKPSRSFKGKDSQTQNNFKLEQSYIFTFEP